MMSLDDEFAVLELMIKRLGDERDQLKKELEIVKLMWKEDIAARQRYTERAYATEQTLREIRGYCATKPDAAKSWEWVWNTCNEVEIDGSE